jgi:hypothetical protein
LHLSSLSAPALFCLGFALLACGGAGGDDPSTPDPSLYGNGLAISDIVGEATWLTGPEDPGCEAPSEPVPADIDGIFVSGVTIGAIDRFDETGEGQLGNIYVQDSTPDPEPYSGITVFGAGFSPPDLRVAESDVVDLLGSKSEFRGPATFPFDFCRTLPEITGTMSFRFDGSTPLQPKTVPLDDLTSYETARQWIGMLIRVDEITVGEPVADPDECIEDKCRYTVPIAVGGGITFDNIPYISNELYNLRGEGPTLVDQQKLRSVTGVLTYFYGFRIAPRSRDDFEL